MARRVVLALVGVLVCVPSAEAATFELRVERECDRGGCITVRVAVFSAGSGESNRVTVRSEGAEVVAREHGAALAAGLDCRQVDTSAVACPAALRRVDVATGDGADVVDASVDVVPVFVHLGEGDDRFLGTASAFGESGADELRAAERAVRFHGGSGDDAILGGPVSDQLDGGPGADVLVGAAGSDVLDVGDVVFDAAGRAVGDAPVSDGADGGPGRDTLTYFARRAATTVDLAAGRGGVAGEDDRVAEIEAVVGGYGDDRIRGDEGPNRLDGYFGSDIVDGRGGDDSLRGGTGVDDHSVLIGGSGDDELAAFGAARLLDGGPGDDTLYTPLAPAIQRCGPGHDLLIWLGGRIIARAEGCERIDADSVVAHLPRRVRDGRMSLRVFCRARRPLGACLTTVAVTNARGHPLGTVRRRIPPRKSRIFSLRLPSPRRPPSHGGRIRPIHVTITSERSNRRRTRVRLELVLRPGPGNRRAKAPMSS